MHLYGYFRDLLPDRIAGVVFALLYAVLILAILVLAATAPADFDYGRY